VSKITNYLNQVENSLICLKPCKLTIELKRDYNVGDNINISEEFIWVNGLISQIEFDDIMFNLILDYPVEVNIYQMEKIKKEKIILYYEKDDSILNVSLAKQEMKEQVLYVKRLLGGRGVYKDTSHLLLKLFKVYGPIASDMDLVHLEVLLSQCLRNKDNVALPARLSKNPDDPVMMNIKTSVFNTGFLQGLAFENVGKALNTGLINETNLPPSILEKVLTGTLVEEKEEF